MDKRKEIHQRVLNATSKQELEKAYGEWAERYDRDLVDEMGYVAPIMTCRILQEHLPDRQARILDAGCGTGLVGEFLQQQGYCNLEGLDYSEKMLDKARQKKAYAGLTRGDLTARLDYPDATYDAIVSVGTFTCGHVGPEALAELIRITRPGGFICFTVRDRAWDEDDYGPVMTKLEQQGRWNLVEEKTADYIREEGSSCRICVYRKSEN